MIFVFLAIVCWRFWLVMCNVFMLMFQIHTSKFVGQKLMWWKQNVRFWKCSMLR